MGVLLQERYRALGTVLGTAPETLPGLDFEEGGIFVIVLLTLMYRLGH